MHWLNRFVMLNSIESTVKFAFKGLDVNLPLCYTRRVIRADLSFKQHFFQTWYLKLKIVLSQSYSNTSKEMGFEKVYSPIVCH